MQVDAKFTIGGEVISYDWPRVILQIPLPYPLSYTIHIYDAYYASREFPSCLDHVSFFLPSPDFAAVQSELERKQMNRLSTANHGRCRSQWLEGAPSSRLNTAILYRIQQVGIGSVIYMILRCLAVLLKAR